MNLMLEMEEMDIVQYMWKPIQNGLLQRTALLQSCIVKEQLQMRRERQ